MDGGIDQAWNVANLLGRLESIAESTGKKVDELVDRLKDHNVQLNLHASDIRSLKESLETIRTGLETIAEQLSSVQRSNRLVREKWLRLLLHLGKYAGVGMLGVAAEMLRRWWGG